MSVQFAKLFEAESYGQILAVSREHEETEQAIIRITYLSPSIDAMIDFSIGYERYITDENEDGDYEARDKAFNSLSEEWVIDAVAGIENAL